MPDFIYMVTLFMVSILVGDTIFRLFKFDFKSTLEKIFFSSGVGFGVLCYTIFLIGIVGLLYKGVVCGVFLFIISISITTNIYLRESICSVTLLQRLKILALWEKIKNAAYIPLCGLLCFFMFCQAMIYYIEVLSPPTTHDTLEHHYLLPLHYIRNHAFVTHERLYFHSFWPQFSGSLYTLCIIIKGDILANHLNYFFCIMLLLAIYVLARSYVSPLFALVAVAIFFCQYTVFDLIVCPGYNLMFNFYFVLSLYSFLEWVRGHKKHWFIVTSLMVGFSLCCMHSGIILLFLFSLGIICIFYFKKRLRLVSVYGLAVLFIVIVLLVVSPWYIRSYILTGNPVYPFFSRIFGGIGSGNVLAVQITHDKSFVGLIKLPWVLTMKELPFTSRPGSPYYLALLPGLLFVKGINRDLKLFLIFGTSWILIFFLSTIQLRYLLPAIILFSIIIGYTLEDLWVKMQSKWQRCLLMPLVFFPIILNVLITFDRNYLKIPVALGLQTRHEYLKGREFYDVFDYINHNIPLDAKIYTPSEGRLYYCERDIVHIENDKMGNISNIEELVKVLIEHKITHFLLNRNSIDAHIEAIKKGYFNWEYNEPLLYKEEFLNSPYCNNVFEKDNVFLYELKLKDPSWN